MPRLSDRVRLLDSQDAAAIKRLLRTSEYIYQRFTLAELPLLLKHYPAVGLAHGMTLQAFLLSQSVNPPSAWIGGFGISWSESRSYLRVLALLLESLIPHLLARGVKYLHYSGNDAGRDWLRGPLLSWGFIPYRTLYAYDKFDYSIPSKGSPLIRVRPVNLVSTRNLSNIQAGGQDDMVALLAIEEACFEELWRYDATAFADIAATHPYFVVAELDGRVVGYQFNALDDEFGYLVRIAVHPSVEGRGIGARLMTEAVHFFGQAHVSRIMLNTQEDNTHAHRLYEWFGFVRVDQDGFVLRKSL